MKNKTQFTCQQCGAVFAKWQGQCDQCGAWNSLVEEVLSAFQKKSSSTAINTADLAQKVLSFSQVKLANGAKQRFSTMIGELDRVLGGGLVPGAVILIGGEPGIGKSTLLTQMVLSMLQVDGKQASNEQTIEQASTTEKILVAKQTSVAKKTFVSKKDASAKDASALAPALAPAPIGKIFYICGEESPNQISLRINRISNNEHKNLEDLHFVNSTNVDEITALLSKHCPALVIVDSIQSLSTADLSGASGSIGQVRECADRLITVAKNLQIPIFLVGHVTKDGAISGPKTLEHMVDSVLQLEGERTGNLRILRALKNRFGATDEVGLFRVVSYGMQEVHNPSEFFLEEQNRGVAGSAIVGVIEGTRPLLLEVQALVVKSQLAMPRRVGRGIELSRIQILSALLQKHCQLPLGNYDIFLSAAGGFKIKEPAVDLGLAMAISSSLQNKPLNQHTVYIGELGLLGEIRSVPYLDQRIKEAKRLGFRQIISRKSNKNISELIK